jgi:peptide/nickel transport system ATP-binding protein
MLERVNIPAPERVFDSYPVELSGGMRQRILISIALLSDPDLLIADEPGTALDVTTEEKILEILDSIVTESGTAVLYITHDMGVAKEITDVINVMYAGGIVESASTKNIFQSPRHPYTRGLLDSVPKLSGEQVSGIDGQLPDYTDPPSGCRFVDRCPCAEPDCKEVPPHPRDSSPNHSVSCHIYSGKYTHERHQKQNSVGNVNVPQPDWNAVNNNKKNYTDEKSEVNKHE